MSYEVAIDQSKEPVYDNVGELHLGGAQREPLYSDPDRNIILTLDHQRSPQRKRRANLAPELDPEENTENYPLYPFPQQIGAELNQHENPLQNREQDLENEGMESLRGLRDSIMGLNQESFSGAKGESSGAIGECSGAKRESSGARGENSEARVCFFLISCVF